jgi:DNA-binding NarL/FixJ family response regulator
VSTAQGSTNAAIRVAIIDDHVVVREGIRAIIETDDRFAIVGDTGDPAQVLRWVRDEAVGVLLTDLRMPGMDGCEVTQRALAADPQLRVLMLTTFDDEDDIVRALEAGACGYLLKDTSRAELLRGVEMAAAGQTVLAPHVAATLAARLRRPSSPVLSQRETDVLRAVGEGLTNAAIGRRLHISEATVKTHLHHVFTKLDVDDRTAAVTKAMQLGLLGG